MKHIITMITVALLAVCSIPASAKDGKASTDSFVTADVQEGKKENSPVNDGQGKPVIDGQGKPLESGDGSAGNT